MSNDEALDFLRSHQPMPPDEDLDPALIERYDEVRQYFLSHPDPRCVPLFLGSFGDGNGLGVYPLVPALMHQFSAELVVPHLLERLRHGPRSVRAWCAEIAGDFPTPELVQPLHELAASDESDLKEAALWSLLAMPGADDALQDLLGVADGAFRREVEDVIRQRREWLRDRR